MKGDTLCLRPVASQMAPLGSWTLAFRSLARTSAPFCNVASLPIESTPLFFLGWHLNGVGPLPPPVATIITARRQGPPLGRRARDTWMATLYFVQKTRYLGATLLGTLEGRDEYTRNKRQGWLVLHFASCSATLQRSRPKPQQADLFAIRQHVARSPTSRTAPLCEQPAQVSVPRLHLFLVLPTSAAKLYSNLFCRPDVAEISSKPQKHQLIHNIFV